MYEIFKAHGVFILRLLLEMCHIIHGWIDSKKANNIDGNNND